MHIDDLLKIMVEKNASDLHITGREPSDGPHIWKTIRY